NIRAYLWSQPVSWRLLLLRIFLTFARKHFFRVQNLALEDPYFHANDTEGGVRFTGGVINVGTQGVQRHTAFVVTLGTSNLGTAKTTADLHFDAFGTLTHGVLHYALHGAAEHHTLLELLGNAVGNQLCIEVRLTDFFDVDVDGHAHFGDQFR